MFFSLVLHNHQPVGQLPWAFEEAWQTSYQPFLETLAEFPTIKIGLHFSGPLLDWLADEKPATITLIQRLLASNQVELLCGGYYEPIFAVWPREDALAQIEKSKARLRQLFGVEARGLWLTERVWEPQLAAWFADAGIKYTLLDSTLFEAAGIPEAETNGTFEIESSGLRTFPINRTLRDLIPWREPHETVEYLRRIQEESGEGAHLLFGDDGEKFGAWPGTFEWIFERGWLRRFFAALENETGWLQVITPAEYSAHHAPRSNIRLEAGSYPEMQAWSGGNWRNFLERYRESRDMHNEVLRSREAATQNETARDHILRAQSNDAYWHGVFGGLYLKHLRQAIYSECAAVQAISNSDEVRISQDEADRILDNSVLRLGARSHGGHLFLLTSAPARHNLLATLRHYREPYQDEHKPTDWYPRGALLDHFFGGDVTLEDFQHARFREEGDFIGEEWRLDSRIEAGAGVLSLRREGGVWHDGVFAPLCIEKKLTLPSDSGVLQVEYSFHNTGDRTLELWWGIEWNTVLSGVDLPERHYHADNHRDKLSLQQPASFPAVTNPIVADNWLGLWLEWHFPEPAAMWHVPLETISQQEGGQLERIHQQSAFVFHRHLKLCVGEKQRFAFSSEVTVKLPQV